MVALETAALAEGCPKLVRWFSMSLAEEQRIRNVVKNDKPFLETLCLCL